METRCHWHYAHPAWGRVKTTEPFSEAEARRLLPGAERVEGSKGRGLPLIGAGMSGGGSPRGW